MKEFIEKLREKAALFSKSDFAVAGIAKDYKDAADVIEKLAEEYVPDTNVGKWIPCSERLPEPEKEVLIMANRKYTGGKIIPIITTAIYENGTILENDSIWNWSDIGGEWNEEEECYIIPEGWFEYRHYNPDEVYNNAIDDKVIAWQPLPEPYKPEQKTRTRIERLRSMSAEELADIIINSEISTCINFCQSDKECDEMLECRVIEDDKCKKCLIKWLNDTEEQKKIPTDHYTERFNRVV